MIDDKLDIVLHELHSQEGQTHRCELCFTTSPTEQECVQKGGADPGVSDRLRYPDSTVIARVSSGPSKPSAVCIRPHNQGQKMEYWKLQLLQCQSRHACSSCREIHSLNPTITASHKKRQLDGDKGQETLNSMLWFHVLHRIIRFC